MLPDAAIGGGGSRQGRRCGEARRIDARALHRPGLRHRRAGAVLRADAQIRMAADRAGRWGGEDPVAGDLRYRRVHRRHRAQGGAGARARTARPGRDPAPRLPCAGPEYGAEGGRDAAPPARRQGQCHRALLRPWRLLGRNEGQFRDCAKGRPPGHAAGLARPRRVRRFGVPARRHAHPAGDGDPRQRRETAAALGAPDRARRARLRARRRPRPTRYEDGMNASQSAQRRQLTRADILPLDEYVKVRRERRREMTELKKQRRVEVGPVATFYFENFATMWQQVQEMLYIEKGGEAQIADELAAYNPLIPQGSELVATVMFEIDDPRRRATTLARLGGIENCAFIDVAGDKVRGEPDPTRENTDPDGKASAVQFIRFPFSPQQIAAFKKPGSQIVIGFDHPNYSHMAVMPEPVRAALAEAFD